MIKVGPDVLSLYQGNLLVQALKVLDSHNFHSGVYACKGLSGSADIKRLAQMILDENNEG